MKQCWKGSTLLNPETPVLVSCGTLDKPNIFTVGWCGTICTRPSMVSISVRPERYSYHLIKESGEFVINLPTKKLLKAVDWCGVRSGAQYDKFKHCHLTATKANRVSAPLLQESPLNLECKVTQSILLGSHEMFIAEVLACDVEEDLLDDNGKLDLERADLSVYSHGYYYSLGETLGSFGFTVKKKK